MNEVNKGIGTKKINDKFPLHDDELLVSGFLTLPHSQALR